MHRLILWVLTSLLLLIGCHAQEKHTTAKEHYVDFPRFAEGRPCPELTFACLPESQDKSWQSIPTVDHIEDLELTPEVVSRYDNIVTQWHKDYATYHSQPHPKGEKKPMLITSLDKDFFDKVEDRRFLEEMEESLAKEFPGFWRDTPKKVRYRWIRRAMAKAKKFGYDPKKNQPIIELCARIGLDFDLDPKWEYITRFVAKEEANIGTAYDYLDFTIFEKNYALDGSKFTDWYLKEAFPDLPRPKRSLPKLNNY